MHRRTFESRRIVEWLSAVREPVSCGLPSAPRSPCAGSASSSVRELPANDELLERLQQFADFVGPQVAAAFDFVTR